MPRIQCPWVACKHNTGDFNPENLKECSAFGECKCNGIVDLHTGDECGTDSENNLTCETFYSKYSN